MISCGTDPKASARSKNAMSTVILLHLISLITSSITSLCSVHPDIPGRNAFWILGSMKLLYVIYVVKRFARMRWKVFTTLFESAMGLKFPGSSVVPFFVYELQDDFSPRFWNCTSCKNFVEECCKNVMCGGKVE